jgi:predicted lipase
LECKRNKYIKQKIKELCINPYTNELDNKTEIPVIKIARELWLQNKEITENNFIEILRQFDSKISNSNLKQYLKKTLEFIESLDYIDYLNGYKDIDKITNNNKDLLKFYINNLEKMWGIL